MCSQMDPLVHSWTAIPVISKGDRISWESASYERAFFHKYWSAPCDSFIRTAQATLISAFFTPIQYHFFQTFLPHSSWLEEQLSRARRMRKLIFSFSDLTSLRIWIPQVLFWELWLQRASSFDMLRWLRITAFQSPVLKIYTGLVLRRPSHLRPISCAHLRHLEVSSLVMTPDGWEALWVWSTSSICTLVLM